MDGFCCQEKKLIMHRIAFRREASVCYSLSEGKAGVSLELHVPIPSLVLEVRGEGRWKRRPIRSYLNDSLDALRNQHALNTCAHNPGLTCALC